MSAVPLAVDHATRLPDHVAAVIVPVSAGSAGDGGSGGNPAEGVLDGELLGRLGFEARPDQVQVLPGDRGAPLLVAVGLGAAGEVTQAGLRRAVAAGVRACGQHAAVGVRLDTAGASLALPVAAQAATEGALLGGYEFGAFRSTANGRSLAEVFVVGDEAAAEGVARGRTVADAVLWARDRINEPGGFLTPKALARAAVALGEECGLEVEVGTRRDIRRLGLGGLLGVSRGSSRPPRLIELRHRPKGPSRGTVALVGKGVTFDSGGLSIKTAAGMMTMKSDMAGAAAVIAATAAGARLDLDVEVRTWVPATDNMTGPDATRPGDVLRMRNGKTVEVLNTDAEGRLILADALALASEAHPDALVDLATLTGAAKVALGPRIAGLIGNHDGWLTQVEAAGAATGEKVWRLPLPREYRKSLDSGVADLKNIAGGDLGAGALVAALVLAEFVDPEIPWAHLDIAGPAWADGDDADVTRGGTGFGVRLLVELLEQFTPPGA